MFWKDRMRRKGGVLLYTNEAIPACEVHLSEEADCEEAIWCKIVTGRPIGNVCYDLSGRVNDHIKKIDTQRYLSPLPPHVIRIEVTPSGGRRSRKP